MKFKKFKSIKNALYNLSTGQFREMKETLDEIESVKFVSKYLETKTEDLSCPHCSSDKLQKWGKVSDMQRYRCKDCLKTFNSLTNTPLARLRKKGRWLSYTKCLKDGFSIRDAAKRSGVSIKTSFHWRHRFLENSRQIKPNKMSGIVELKELSFPLSFKGSKADFQKYLEENSKPIQKQKVFVVFARDRYRNTFDDIIVEFKQEKLSESLMSLMSTDSLMCSENNSVFVNSISKLGLRHGKLNLRNNEFVKKAVVHIKTVQGYNNELENWMLRFKGVATKYLNSYLSWYRSLDEFNMQISPVKLLLRAKQVDRYIHQ